MTLEEIRNRLKPFNLKMVADATDMKYQQLYLIASGRNKNPTYEAVCKIIKFLDNV